MLQILRRVEILEPLNCFIRGWGRRFHLHLHLLLLLRFFDFLLELHFFLQYPGITICTFQCPGITVCTFGGNEKRRKRKEEEKLLDSNEHDVVNNLPNSVSTVLY